MSSWGDPATELAAADKAIEAANKLLAKVRASARAENNSKVRAWRLNINANIERLSRAHKARLSEDKVAALSQAQQRINRQLAPLSTTLRSEADVESWLAAYRACNRAIAGLSDELMTTQPRWLSELGSIRQELTESYNRVQALSGTLSKERTKRQASEDAYAQLVREQQNFNAAVSDLTMHVSSPQEARSWQEAYERYKRLHSHLEALREAPSGWQDEAQGIEAQAQAAAGAVEDFLRSTSRPQAQTVVDEDVVPEIQQDLERRFEANGDDEILRVEVRRNPYEVRAVPVSQDELLAAIRDSVDAFNSDIVDSYIDGEIADVDLDREVRQESGLIADYAGKAVAEAIINRGFYPGNPAGRQLEKVKADDTAILQAATQYAEQRAQTYAPRSYERAVTKSTAPDPIQLTITGRLSAPKPVRSEVHSKATVAVTSRLSRPIVHVEERATLPQDVAGELLSYTHGKYTYTIKHADEINAYHHRYGTLPLVVDTTHASVADDEVSALSTALNGVLAESEAFSKRGQGNSRHGQTVIHRFKAARNRLVQARTAQSIALTNAIQEFVSATIAMRRWYTTSWYQGGGQPGNHKNSGKNDGSQNTYSSPTRRSKLKASDL